MVKLTLAVLAGTTLTLATPVYAARGGGAGTGNVAMSGAGQAMAKVELCRHQRCENPRRKPCKVRRGWFAEGLDPLIR
ncbi:MAG: hypothetical protein JWM65_1492 [Sphingomonas bacterium]|nr:hypothetical protein [Sphingomonas bacterium]